MNEYQACTYSLAKEVWDSDEDAHTFMNQPHSLLDGAIPLALAATEEGAARVERVLRNLRWGMPA
ncbi:MAG: MbcA/ParS/Xre antitoxin family protein [Rhodocyclaceae bacterium]|jgi:uncharacterized protein (DUF2384 family)|nr:MbcA/ParS/Xre antitoxin family protein [Rhodocyclaceae bacterium]